MDEAFGSARREAGVWMRNAGGGNANVGISELPDSLADDLGSPIGVVLVQPFENLGGVF